ITELTCEKCKTVVKGTYPLNKFLTLDPQEEEFLLVFLLSKGNLKEVQERLDISYPTAKNRLEELLVSLGLTETKKEDKVESFFEEDKISKIEEILEEIEKGEITGEEAIEKMKEVKDERGDD
ncbi:MAG TPA: DUF2089 family protein, partial [Caldisericia bacterium]|nr:DUF2089 family protein [Caldisericia bacterium]